MFDFLLGVERHVEPVKDQWDLAWESALDRALKTPDGNGSIGAQYSDEYWESLVRNALTPPEERDWGSSGSRF